MTIGLTQRETMGIQICHASWLTKFHQTLQNFGIEFVQDMLCCISMPEWTFVKVEKLLLKLGRTDLMPSISVDTQHAWLFRRSRLTGCKIIDQYRSINLQTMMKWYDENARASLSEYRQIRMKHRMNRTKARRNEMRNSSHRPIKRFYMNLCRLMTVGIIRSKRRSQIISWHSVAQPLRWMNI